MGGDSVAIHLNSGNHEAPLSEINVTPLVDVMLVLLVIFIIVAPMFSQSIRVDLPKVEAKMDVDPVVVDLTLDRQGQLYLQGELINFSQLSGRLLLEQSVSPDLVVRISADAETDYARVAQLLSSVQTSGVYRLAFATRSPQVDAPMP